MTTATITVTTRADGSRELKVSTCEPIDLSEVAAHILALRLTNPPEPGVARTRDTLTLESISVTDRPTEGRAE